MREAWLQDAIQPCSKQRTCDGRDHHCDAVADQREQRTGTSTGERPAQAEDGAAQRVTDTASELGGIVISSPDTVFNLSRLISATETAATTTAEAMISYMRGD